MGNVLATDRSRPEAIDTEAGANRVNLDELVETSPYLNRYSDIIALMVLEHQTQMHNFLTLANYETRRAEHYDSIMAKALGRSDDYRSDSRDRRIAGVADKLVRYMLFEGEFELTAPVSGVSDFADEFSSRGPRDGRGRSLRDFDLQTRLFKYPCSYLIYSPSFDELPPDVKQEVYRRLGEVLAGDDPSGDFDHLSAGTRNAIREILLETKPEVAGVLTSS
jgi:hypothetical protein